MLDDTIAAVSSPQGHSARGVIRISGPLALRLASAVFKADAAVGADWPDMPGHRRVPGRIAPLPDREAAAPADVPAAAYVFRAPRSYTRQDVVELHLPGSPGLLALTLDALIAAGARPAEPGEFTARAVQAGALDLAAAEGVIETIYARSDGQLRAARRLVEGSLSRDAAAAGEVLDNLRAQVEAALDFADEDIEFIPPAELAARLRETADHLRVVAGSDARAERLAEPPLIVLCGPPNAGKSTLLNRLTGVDRAICSPLAGTTRDALTAPIRLPHGEALLCDTAGLGEADGGMDTARPPGLASSAADVMRDRARRAAWQAIERAAICVWVTAIDHPVAPPADLFNRTGALRMMLINKRDLHAPQNARPLADAAAALGIGEASCMVVSARGGEGCAELLDRLEALLHLESVDSADQVLLSADLRRAIHDSIACIDRAIALAEASADRLPSAELVAAELFEAARRLGRLTGAPDVEQLYDRIFARFCVGK